jgi:hypothetical protein
MPLQNRVTPDGDIVATSHRGTMMGNRGGCFHRDDRTLSKRRWASKQWICCVLSFKARKRQLMQPGLYTELFFLDEATALAAGHRPCFECRRADAVQFQRLWAETTGRGVLPRAGDMDEQLHAERIPPPQARGQRPVSELPAGAFVQVEGEAYLVAGRDSLRSWSFDGYGAVELAPSQPVTVLTPPSIVTVLSAGYRPRLHASAVEGEI